MKPVTCSVLALLFVLELFLWAGVGGHETVYVGGTVPDLKEKTEGRSSTSDEKALIFEYKNGRLVIFYERIDSLEYGQKAGRRVGLAIAISPLFLFSKKRRHYLTVGYKDENNKQQAAVFEIGKGGIRETLAALETRTGKKVEYQDEESRKSATGK